MKKTFIIAEAGVNHNGNIELAYKLIDEAVKAVSYTHLDVYKRQL